MASEFKNCGGCRYSYGINDMRCRRYPPIPLTETIGLFKQKIVYEFPVISSNDVCGEWRVKNTEWIKWPPELKKE